MSDPSSPGGPFEGLSLDETRTAEIDVDCAGANPPNTPASGSPSSGSGSAALGDGSGSGSSGSAGLPFGIGSGSGSDGSSGSS